MKHLRGALVQVNVTVGALRPNAHKIARLAHAAREAGARLIVFPELVLSGYPPEDLVLKRHFMQDCRAALALLAGEVPKDAVVIAGTPLPERGRGFNAAAVLAGGRLLGFYRKMLLPNYGVFDEKRVFAAGAHPLVLDLDAVRVGLHICEDSWFPNEAPCRALRAARVDAVVNISASPYHRGKLKLRENVMRRAARVIGAPLLCCNLVGGQDELVFDGGSLVVSAQGKLLARARQFEEDVLFFDIPIAGRKARQTSTSWKIQRLRVPGMEPSAGESSPAWTPCVAPALDDLAEVYAALKLGVRDYMDKNGFSRAVVGLSGGVDSALVATIAADALGCQRVVGITMPSRYSSGETLSDAHRLARNLDIEMHSMPIKKLHDAYLEELARLWPNRLPDTTEENLQARIRGNIAMALSNKFGWLVLTTGNKSEMATGYCTLYGDMAGGFALIKDVPKTLVFDLARWRNRTEGREVIPRSTIERAPSAELRENQKDTDSLPAYEILDPIIERYVEQDRSVDDMVAAGFDAATVKRVVRLIDRNEYKRRQGAPGVKITPKAFGRDRRLPITNLYGERA
jgi:NAD+ synthase (glutamine-hydrolysing)